LAGGALVREFLYFSEGRLSDTNWTATQYIISNLSKKSKVLCVESPMSKTKLIKKLFKFEINDLIIHNINTNLYVWSRLNLLPCSSKISILKKINIIIDCLLIKKLLKKCKIKTPIIFINSQKDLGFIDKIKSDLIIYGCNNDPLTFPVNKKVFGEIYENEKLLLDKADIVICTSLKNYERKKAINKNTYQIRLGVDYKLFAENSCDTEPDEIKIIKKPIIGFVGALDNYKVDFELIKKIAITYEDYSIVIIGKTSKSIGSSTNKNEFPFLPNIYYLGHKKKDEVPNYINLFDVCIIPYLINDYTNNLTTMKFFEYMASGKPIVISSIPELLQYKDVVKIGYSHEDFINKIKLAINDTSTEASLKRKNIAKKYSWDSRVEEIYKYIDYYNTNVVKR